VKLRAGRSAIARTAIAVLGCATLAVACEADPSTPHTSTAGLSTPSPSASTPSASSSAARPSAAAVVPRYAHIVVVVMENHADSQIIGSRSAPFINELARAGLRLTASYGVTHPSQPNYLALFSGSTHGVTSDSCPHTFDGANLGSELRAHHLSFVGYSEALPRAGYTGCAAGLYARKHAPWANFRNLPASVNQPFTAFPSTFTRLPTVSFVVPDLNHDMHNGTVAQGDAWLMAHLARYAAWSLSHDSLLLITWDEDDLGARNHIPTVLYGADIQSGTDSAHATHYTILRTIEAAYRLPALGHSATTAPLSADWQS
jgi:phosphatidylinositol-3-phosphatase